MMEKIMRRVMVPMIAIAAFLGLNSFVDIDEKNPYGTCDKSNSNPCKITKSDGTVVTNSTGAWVAP